jgi:enoyl-CoA hydratase
MTDLLTGLVTYSRQGRIGVLTLNRPYKRNALSGEMLADFHRALDELQSENSIHVGVLRGAGPSFCAGFDLERTSASVSETVHDPWGDRTRLRGWIELGIRLWEFPIPVIAQVHGHCLAGGILLPMCCDLVVITETCVVGWPRLPIGAGFLDGAMSQLIGQRRAKELSFIVGSRIDGRRAAEWGYANMAVPADRLETETLVLAGRIARTPRNVLEIRKAAITRANIGMSFRDVLQAGAEWDVIAHVDPAVQAMRRLVRDRGMHAVIDAFESSDDPVDELGLGQDSCGS